MKLYVGTYAKYNSGDLSGAWLDLDKFANAEEFEAACKRIHKDERDPELMFQDVETDPGCDWQEGLYCESSIPRDYWTLKAEFAAKVDDEPAKGSAAKAEQARLLAVYMERKGYDRERKPQQYEKMQKFYRASCFFVELEDGTVLDIERPSIETRFCCGEDDRGQGGEGPGTMAYAHKVLEAKRTERGFKGANLGKFDRRMVHVVGRRAWRFARNEGRGAETWRGDFVPCLMRGACTDGRVYLGNAANMGRPEEVVRFLSDEDMRRMRRGYMAVRTDFRKRLNAYWKRFGASKIHTWTYWTEA